MSCSTLGGATVNYDHLLVFSLAVQFLAPAWTVKLYFYLFKSLAIHPVWTILGTRKFSQRLSDLTWNTFSDISRSMDGTHLK